MDLKESGHDRRADAAQTPWAAITGVMATVSVFAIAQGLAYPLLSFILKAKGTPAALIGLSAAMTPLGLIASAPLIPALSRRFGERATALTCAVAAGVLFAAIGWTRELGPWFPLRFLLGVVVGPLYVLSEVWLINLSPPGRRGRIVGIYATAISAGFVVGPISLMLVGTAGWPPFLVGVAAFAACSAFLAATLPRLPEVRHEGATPSIRAFLRLAPVLLLSVAVMAAFEQSILSLLPVYALAHGIGERGASTFLTALIGGNIALQLPIGMAAERWGARAISIACAAGSALGCLLLPAAIGLPLQWPLAFLWGALSYGIYTVAILDLGNRFSGPMLIAGNATFALMWGLGGIAGPPIAGSLMDALGAEGLPLMLGAMCLGLAAAGWRAPERADCG